MDSQPVRGPGKPRSHRFSATAEPGCVWRPSGRDDDCRGIHGVAHGVAADRLGGPWLRLEMEYGLDARYPRVHEARPDQPQVSPRTTDVLADLCLQRKFRAAAVSRRSG